MKRFTVIKLLYSGDEPDRYVVVPDSWILWKSCNKIAYCTVRYPAENPFQISDLDITSVKFGNSWNYLFGIIKSESVTYKNAKSWIRMNSNKLAKRKVSGVNENAPREFRETPGQRYGANVLQILAPKAASCSPLRCMSKKRPLLDVTNEYPDKKKYKLYTTATSSDVLHYQNQKPDGSHKLATTYSNKEGTDQRSSITIKPHIIPDLFNASLLSSKRSQDRLLLAVQQEHSQGFNFTERNMEERVKKENIEGTDESEAKDCEIDSNPEGLFTNMPTVCLTPESEFDVKETNAEIFRKLNTISEKMSPFNRPNLFTSTKQQTHSVTNEKGDISNAGSYIHQTLIDVTNLYESATKSHELLKEYTVACQQLIHSLEVFKYKLRALERVDYLKRYQVAESELEVIKGQFTL